MSNQAPVVDRIRIIPRPDDFLDRNVGSSGEVFFDGQAKTLRLFDGKIKGGVTVYTSENLAREIYQSGIASITREITVDVDPEAVYSQAFYIDGEANPGITLVRGYSYIFDQSDNSNISFNSAIHPFIIKNGSDYYTQGVTYVLGDNPVSAETYISKFNSYTERKTIFSVSSSTSSGLTYDGGVNSNMGNTITLADPGTGTGAASSGASIDVSDTAPVSPESGNIWYNSTNGRLYVYVEDTDSSQWVQPSVPIPDTSAFKNIAFNDSTQFSASGDDTLTLKDGFGIEITSDAIEKSLTIAIPSSYEPILRVSDGTVGQVLTTDGAGNYTFQDTASGSNQGLDTTDDVVFNSVSADTFTNTGVGAADITSASTLTLTAPDGVIVSQGPFRLPSFTTVDKDGLAAVNGDMVYDTDLNKAQVYENGAWVSLV